MILNYFHKKRLLIDCSSFFTIVLTLVFQNHDIIDYESSNLDTDEHKYSVTSSNVGTKKIFVFVVVFSPANLAIFDGFIVNHLKRSIQFSFEDYQFDQFGELTRNLKLKHAIVDLFTSLLFAKYITLYLTKRLGGMIFK